jgi:filamentous hemagglutinin family protein
MIKKVLGGLVSLYVSQMSITQAEITIESTGETISGDMTISQDLGLTRGNNLLHTFLTFNIDAGESATFTGSNDISNIIARVSGDSASQIDGLLRSTITDANLFLINPNGIAFGAGASIDVNGSVHISTADSIVFADDSRLLVSDTGASGFTTAAPAAFGFGDAAAGISFDGVTISTLETDRLSMLSLVGGDIDLSESSITVAGGDIDVFANGGAQDIALAAGDRDLAIAELGVITISNEVFTPGKIDLNTSGEAAGRLSLSAAEIGLTRAFVFSDTEGNGTGGAIDVWATDALVLSEGARITTDATGGGAGGDLSIQSASVSLSGTNTALAASTLSAGGDAGNIDVVADSVSIVENAQISSVTSNASPGGDITITTGVLTMASGGQIAGQATSRGQGADVVINATDRISIDATGTSAGEETGIRVDSINFLPFFTGGDAGDIVITAPTLNLTGNAVIAAQATLPSSGAPGAITLNVDDLVINGGSRISTLTSSSVDAGAIVINTESLQIAGSGSSITATSQSSATGGSITLSGNTISVVDGATVTVNASSSGDAGDISLIALERLAVLDGAQIKTNAENSGGGNVTIDVIDTIYLRDSTVTASAGGTESDDNGGNISIDPRFVILDNASIVAQAVAGNGGLIDLVADNYIADTQSFLDASSELGNDGEVRITTPYNSISGVLGTLPVSFDAVADISSDACSARNLEERSSLLVQKRLGNLSVPSDLTPIVGEGC